MDGGMDGWMNQWMDDERMDVWMENELMAWLRILLWLHVNIAANTVPTEAINSIATAISTLPDTAVTSAYATAKAGPLLAK